MKEQSMTSKFGDCSSQGPPQGDNTAAAPQAGPPELQNSRSRNQVFKSGPLFISSKGIGWTSWKKRWFILTRTSLVFFRSDPSSAPQKGGEVNLTLGGIDLNNSASVEVKADKKLLTVFFPDGRDGRAFTLKAETTEDLQEWKTALENALAQAPIATNNAGQNGILNSEQADAANGTADQQKDGPPGKSMVIGRPILLALEDIDGSPSFLEKALRFMEFHGARIEGILRQAADVDDVYRRVREYEQGKNEFTPDEDAHVISDCIKYILRELPSSPVPATCCNALLEAFRSDRNNRINAMRTAVLETFPEPNRRLLQRILLMMQTVISYKTVNRMSTSAVAACMSPLLLRPLLAGDCELESTHMDVAGDGSFQLLQAAAAANHAQAIVITLLDEYDKIFGEGSMLNSGLFSDSDESGSGTEEASDDDDLYEDDDDDDEDYHEDDDDEDDDYHEDDDDYEHSVTETCSGSGDHGESDSCDDDKHSERSSSSPERAYNHLARQRSSSVSPHTPEPQHDHQQSVDDNMKRTDNRQTAKVESTKLHRDIPAEISTITESDSSRPPTPKTGRQLPATKFLGSSQFKRQRWGRTSAKKNLSMESIDFAIEDEDEIERLEAEKLELQNQIEEEAKGNSALLSNLERRKKALHERRLALEKEVSRLQEQLQKERDLRASLEAGSRIDEKTHSELQQIALFFYYEENFSNLKQRLDDIDTELNQQHQQTAALLQDKNNKVPGSFSQEMLVLNKDNAMKNERHVEERNKNEGQHKYNKDGADCDGEWRIESAKGQQNNKLDGVHRDNDQKNESPNENQNQPNDKSQGGSSKFGGLPSNASSTETPITIPTPSTSKKTSSKGEERRNQIATELQSIDKGRGSSTQPALSPGKEKVPEPIHTVDNPNKNQNSEGSFPEKVGNQTSQSSSSSSSHNSGMGSSTEVEYRDSNTKTDNKDSNTKTDNKDSNKKTDNKDSNKKTDNRDENNKTDNKDFNKKGSGLKSDAASSHQNQQQLGRIKSEGSQPSSKNSEKGRRKDGQQSTSRTLSR